jgi:integrase
MASHLFNRGRGIVWRRRIPPCFAGALGRSHVLVYLGTRDPREAARLGRRLSVVFDDFLEAMNTITRTPTPEDLENLLQIFRKIVRERCETAQLLCFQPTDEQRQEIERQKPATLEELDALFVTEQAILGGDPEAQAALDERRAAISLTRNFRDPGRLAGVWLDAMQRNDPNSIRDLLAEALRIANISMPPQSLAYAKLARTALQQGVEEIQAFRGQELDVQPIAASPLMSQLEDLFIANKNESHDGHKGYAAQTEKQTRLTFKLWRELNGDRPMREYAREDAWRFYDTLKKLPKHHGKSEYDEKTIEEQVAWAEEQDSPVERLKLKTVKRHFTAVNQFWKWAKVRGHVNEIISVGFEFPGTRSSKQKRRAWPDEMLLKLFHSDWWGPQADRDTARYWVALIALHCGLRREEACQLYVSDIKERDSILFFDLAETDGRRLKTESAVREVPVHPFLLELGFEELVERRREKKEKFLFADIKPSAPLGKRGDRLTKDFGVHIRSIGIDDPKIVLHSFRHNFRTVLESAQLEERWIDTVMGHENPRKSEGAKSYSKSITLQRANEVVCAFASPVDLKFLIDR